MVIFPAFFQKAVVGPGKPRGLLAFRGESNLERG